MNPYPAELARIETKGFNLGEPATTRDDEVPREQRAQIREALKARGWKARSGLIGWIYDIVRDGAGG